MLALAGILLLLFAVETARERADAEPGQGVIFDLVYAVAEALLGAYIVAAVREVESRHPEGDVPLPPHWGGYILSPSLYEFWQGRPSRLHDRVQYRYAAGSWLIERLAP